MALCLDLPAHCALVAGVPGLETLRGCAGQRGVPVHAEGVVVLVALLATSADASTEKVSGWRQRVGAFMFIMMFMSWPNTKGCNKSQAGKYN